MVWKVVVFETKRGEKPVEDFIKSLSSFTISKIVHEIDLLEKYGNMLRMPHSKMIMKNLYELRIKGKEEVRLLYTFKLNSIFILHGFQKKTNKTPRKEIEIALKRIDTI